MARRGDAACRSRGVSEFATTDRLAAEQTENLLRRLICHAQHGRADLLPDLLAREVGNFFLVVRIRDRRDRLLHVDQLALEVGFRPFQRTSLNAPDHHGRKKRC